jgi:hypothetical protein
LSRRELAISSARPPAKMTPKRMLMRLVGRRMRAKKSTFSSARLWRILVYCAATAMLFALDSVVENMKSSSEISFDSVYTQVFSPTSLYPWTSGWLEKPRTINVAVVTIGKDEPPEVLSDQCTRRAYLADVISGILGITPRAVVIDYAFGQGNCLDEQALPLTRKLLRALIDASHLSVVILGQAAYREEDLETNWPSKFLEMRRRGFGRADLLPLSLPGAFTDLNSKVKPGLIQLNSDYRKIPLSWTAFSESDDQFTRMDTLSVAAVKAFSTDRLLLDQIAHLQSAGKHPFTSFAREDQFTIISGADIACAQIDVAKCQVRNMTRFSSLKDRVILVGFIDPEHNSDIHETLIGTIPGVILQANYIESLLDHRFLRPVDWRIQIVVGLVWFALIELLLKQWPGRGWRIVFYPLLTIVLLWTIVSVFITRAGFYIELLFPSLFVLIAARTGEKIKNLVDFEPKQ